MLHRQKKKKSFCMNILLFFFFSVKHQLSKSTQLVFSSPQRNQQDERKKNCFTFCFHRVFVINNIKRSTEHFIFSLFLLPISSFFLLTSRRPRRFEYKTQTRATANEWTKCGEKQITVFYLAFFFILTGMSHKRLSL
jgi:hypothetical protein